MNNLLAKIISVVFHPLLITTYIFGGVLICMPLTLSFSPSLSWKFLSMIFMTTFLIPFAGIVVLKFTRTISKLEMDDKKERFFPFLFISIFYGVTTYLFWDKFRFPPLVINILISVSISLVILTAITLFWKISAHALAISGAAGIFVALLFGVEPTFVHYAVVVAFLLTGVVGSARLRLNAHTDQQVWIGYLIGFLVNFISILILN